MKSKEQIKNEYEELKKQSAQATVMQTIVKNLSSSESKCEHNMVVLLGYKELISGTNMCNNIPVYKCLFCGAEKNSNVELKKSIKIDTSNYCRNNFDMKNETSVATKFNIIRNIIFKMAQDLPEITNEELQTMANQTLNGYSYIKKHD